MKDDRLQRLRFMADHNGLSPEAHARMVKEGRSLEEHGAMIPLTPLELQELLP